MTNKPILSFCYTKQPVKSSQDLDDIRSTASYRTDGLTYRSATSSKTSVQRINQIKPKSKIIIPTPKPKQQKPISKKMYTQPNDQQDDMERPMLTFNAQAINNQKQNKGLLGWGGLGILCGMPVRKQIGQGCTCINPCPYKQQWTKSHQKSDLAAYIKLRGVKATAQHVSQIDKDIFRTYTQSLTFNRHGIFRQMLRQVLLTYSVYDLELGYVQGLNSIVAILLYHIKDAQKTFWALVQLMQCQQLRMIYVGKLEYLQSHCMRIEKLIENNLKDLYNHIMYIGIDIKIVLHGWLLSLMSKLIPLQEMHTVLNNFRKNGWSYIYKVIIACLQTVKDCLLVSQDQSQFMDALKQRNFQELDLEWSTILKEALKISIE